mmetsp:Transcript_2566/g.4684  ORF Transcript_2566/g.4684 Transcript_2566/m.4684 type:complete len:492 (+) Transcript_2566:156-1631(+)
MRCHGKMAHRPLAVLASSSRVAKALTAPSCDMLSAWGGAQGVGAPPRRLVELFPQGRHAAVRVRLRPEQAPQLRLGTCERLPAPVRSAGDAKNARLGAVLHARHVGGEGVLESAQLVLPAGALDAEGILRRSHRSLSGRAHLLHARPHLGRCLERVRARVLGNMARLSTSPPELCLKHRGGFGDAPLRRHVRVAQLALPLLLSAGHLCQGGGLHLSRLATRAAGDRLDACREGAGGGRGVVFGRGAGGEDVAGELREALREQCAHVRVHGAQRAVRLGTSRFEPCGGLREPAADALGEVVGGGGGAGVAALCGRFQICGGGVAEVVDARVQGRCMAPQVLQRGGRGGGQGVDVGGEAVEGGLQALLGGTDGSVHFVAQQGALLAETHLEVGDEVALRAGGVVARAAAGGVQGGVQVCDAGGELGQQARGGVRNKRSVLVALLVHLVPEPRHRHHQPPHLTRHALHRTRQRRRLGGYAAHLPQHTGIHRVAP